jgi:hypothetical protein
MTSKPHTIAVAAFADPVACMHISMIGKLEFKAASSGPMVYRITMIMA